MSRPGVSDKSRTKPQQRSAPVQPPLFRVVMHNDDYTTMEFVVEALMSVFHKGPTEANRIMLHIHFRGEGVCGVFPFEVAETKVARVHAMARSRGFPLRCSLDPA